MPRRCAASRKPLADHLERRVREQLASALQTHVRQINVRRYSGDLFEQPREVILREVCRSGDLLKRKLGSVKDANLLRHDPDTLVAMVADAQRLIEWYRKHAAQLEQELRDLDLLRYCKPILPLG